MIYLPNRIVEAKEEQENFEYLERIISAIRFEDTPVLEAVKGVSAQKLMVVDTQGIPIGFVPMYPE